MRIKGIVVISLLLLSGCGDLQSVTEPGPMSVGETARLSINAERPACAVLTKVSIGSGPQTEGIHIVKMSSPVIRNQAAIEVNGQEISEGTLPTHFAMGGEEWELSAPCILIRDATVASKGVTLG